MIESTDPKAMGRPDPPSDPAQGAVDLEILFSEANALSIRLKQSLRGTGERLGTAPGGTEVLRTLARDGAQTVPRIARTRGTSRQNIQILVNRLAKEGCLEFVGNPAHRRSDLVRLTERGAEALASAATRQEKVAEAIFRRLSRTEVRSAATLLGRVREALASKYLRPAEAQAEGTRTPRKGRSGAQAAGSPGAVQPLSDASALGEESEELPLSLL
jgi:DNA-binding MarR family transcriptional regulator